MGRVADGAVGIPPRKVSSFLRPIKDDLAFKTLGVYSIPCKCGKFYIGQTGHSIETRVNLYGTGKGDLNSCTTDFLAGLLTPWLMV
jgi:hypothetical protein